MNLKNSIAFSKFCDQTMIISHHGVFEMNHGDMRGLDGYFTTKAFSENSDEIVEI